MIRIASRYSLNTNTTLPKHLKSSVNTAPPITKWAELAGPGNYSNGLIEDSGRIFIPGDHPFNFFIEDPGNPEALIYIGPDAWDNDIHTGADISGRARILGNEFNGRNSPADRRSDIQNFRALQGVSIDFGETLECGSQLIWLPAHFGI